MSTENLDRGTGYVNKIKIFDYILFSATIIYFIYYLFTLFSQLYETFFWADENIHSYVANIISQTHRFPFVLPDDIYGGFKFVYPPLFHIISACVISIAGFSALKFFNLGLLFIFLSSSFILIRKYYGKYEAIIACLLLSLSPIIAINIAVMAQDHNWGLLNYLDLPGWLSIIVGVLLLDMIVYLQHVMFHAVPILWRLHMVHHADLDYDVTTGLRFHPIEIIISMGIKMGSVAALGVSPFIVIVFEIVLNATAMFNHGNIKLPSSIDKLLRLLVVTPDMHRVHHSVIIRETNSNFGFNFPWWDRLMGTYRAQPAAGHEGMTIGLAQFRDSKRNILHWMLALPFIGDTGSYAINRWGRDPMQK